MLPMQKTKRESAARCQGRAHPAPAKELPVIITRPQRSGTRRKAAEKKKGKDPSLEEEKQAWDRAHPRVQVHLERRPGLADIECIAIRLFDSTQQIYASQLPAAYHLTARFPDDFESAVLHAVNGGGENQARAVLTGALAGAQTGLSGIPRRFLEGLDEADTLQRLAMDVASKVGTLIPAHGS